MNVLSAILNVFLLISKEVDAQITNMDTKDEITENFEQLLVGKFEFGGKAKVVKISFCVIYIVLIEFHRFIQESGSIS